MILSGTAWAGVRSPLLAIDTARVAGATHTSADDALRAGGIRRGAAMMDLDERAAAARIERLPWVARATVVRRWPKSVEVHVVERIAVAMVRSDDDQSMVVDGAGRVLGRPSATSATVPLVEVRSPSQPGARIGPEAGDALAVAGSLPPNLIRRISSVVPGADGGVELRLDSGVTVRLGRSTQLREKLAALATILEQVNLVDVTVVDVRIPQTPVLTRRAALAKVSTEGAA